MPDSDAADLILAQVASETRTDRTQPSSKAVSPWPARWWIVPTEPPGFSGVERGLPTVPNRNPSKDTIAISLLIYEVIDPELGSHPSRRRINWTCMRNGAESLGRWIPQSEFAFQRNSTKGKDGSNWSLQRYWTYADDVAYLLLRLSE
jgi:hypothetical protein